MQEFEVFTINNEEGEEHSFMLLKEIEMDGSTYWICNEAFVNEENDNPEEITFGDTVAFKVSKNGEEVIIDSIEDDKEFEKISSKWEELQDEEEIEEDDLEFIEEDDQENK